MTNIRILGIDPGFDRMGLCVLQNEGNKETLLHSSCVVTDRKAAFGQRLAALGKELGAVLKKYKPEELAIEKLFFAKNQTTAIQVAEVRGVVLYLSELHGLSVYEYSPPQVKVAVGGHGKADKRDIALMVPRILKIENNKDMLDDEIDAIAIALTHSAHRKTISWKSS